MSVRDAAYRWSGRFAMAAFLFVLFLVSYSIYLGYFHPVKFDIYTTIWLEYIGYSFGMVFMYVLMIVIVGVMYAIPIYIPVAVISWVLFGASWKQSAILAFSIGVGAAIYTEWYRFVRYPWVQRFTEVPPLF